MADTPKKQTVKSLPYIDIQHDALTVYDEIVQNVVTTEDIWVSGYKVGSSSAHGKISLEAVEGEENVRVSPRGGVKVEHDSRTNFRVSFPAFDIPFTTVRFPRQIINPPYTRVKSTTPPLHINSLAYSPQKGLMAVGGPDGYLCVVPAGMHNGEEAKEFKGHVGDVLDVKFFPSGEVILSTSSDLSIRIWGLNGSNPRTLKGHTRAVTCTAIVGIGKQVLSGSKDASVRLWNVGEGREVRKWTTEGRIAVEEVLLDDEEQVISAFRADGDIEMFELSGGEAVGRIEGPKDVGGLNCAVWDRKRGIVGVGYTSGIVHLRKVNLGQSVDGKRELEVKREIMVRRNEASVYSLAWAGEDLLVGTAAGLPCRLSVELGDGKFSVGVKEELAGWEAVGVEGWAVGPDGGVWAAGGEGGIRRY